MAIPVGFSECERWMGEALLLADEAARLDEVPVGAILVRHGEILGRGFNRREATSRTTAHAEIMALEDFNHRYGTWRLPPETTLYVTAEPCLMCTGAMVWGRLDFLAYGCSDPRNAGFGRVAQMISDGALDHRFREVQGGILSEQCSARLKRYFLTKRLKD